MSASAIDFETRIGDRIHALRAARGLTLKALAGRAAVSRAMLSRIERGESSPTAHLLNKICNGLGITLAALFAAAEAPAGTVTETLAGTAAEASAGTATEAPAGTAKEAPAGPPAAVAITRRAGQPLWRDPASHYLRRQVAPPGTGSPVEIVEVEFPGHGEVAFDAQDLPGTDQHIWVLDGRLELALGDEEFQLDQGDCLRMRFGAPIRFRNPMARPIRYAVILGHGGPP
ncbi:MAG: DNA-binding protein [Belnapia sp.]|nr:DNA-binding protein [Belnapia sp.]